MDTKDLKVGLLIPGGFDKLPVHAGALWALIKFGFFRPFRIISASGGGLMALAMAPWNKRHADKVIPIVESLSYRKIFTFPKETVVPAAAAVVAATAPFWPFFEPEALSRKTRAIVRTGMAIGVGVAFVWFIKRLVTAKSAFSNHPLYNLLSRTLDFRAIVNSDVEVEVIMCGVPEGQNVIMGTHEGGLTFEHMLAGAIGTCSIPIYFGVADYRGQPVTDGEGKTNYPVELLEDMDIIFRLSYYPPEAYPKWDTGLDHFNVLWSIWARDRYYADRQKYEERRRENPDLPEVVEIRSERKIPQLEINAFSQTGLSHSIGLGKKIIDDNRTLIEKKLQEALERKRQREQ